MAKEWTDDEVASEIAKAVQIVREDRFEAFVRSRLPAPANPDTSPNSSPPPNSDNPPTPKKKSLWWGDTE